MTTDNSTPIQRIKVTFFIVGAIMGIGIGYAIFGYKNPTAQQDMSTMDMQQHTHPMLEVDQTKPIPTVTLQMEKDAKDGYNLHIVTTNFTFTPEKVNQTPVTNEGHAHLYINGIKVARVYGNWFNISDSMLTFGDNLIEVTLNANDHSEWMHNGQHIATQIHITNN